MATVIPTCAGCAHLDEGACSAYPEGIPNAIAFARADHRLPLPNDRGVRFTPRDDAGLRLVESVWGEEPQPYSGPWPGSDPNAA